MLIALDKEFKVPFKLPKKIEIVPLGNTLSEDIIKKYPKIEKALKAISRFTKTTQQQAFNHLQLLLQ